MRVSLLACRSDTVAYENALVLHATAVAFGTAGLLITGKSGSGKSTLALQLMSLGAQLVADDRVSVLRQPEGGLLLSAPDTLSGLIEARGMGVLTCQPTKAIARVVVDLDRTENKRLPDPKEIVIAGESLRVFAKVESPAFPAMLRIHLDGT